MGSEMCIRDRMMILHDLFFSSAAAAHTYHVNSRVQGWCTWSFVSMLQRNDVNLLLSIALNSQHGRPSDHVANPVQWRTLPWRFRPMQTQELLVPMVKFAPHVGSLGHNRMVAATDAHTHLHCCKVAFDFMCGSEGFHPRGKADVLPSASRCFCLLGCGVTTRVWRPDLLWTSERHIRISAEILAITSLQDRRRLTQEPSELLSSAPGARLHSLQPASRCQSIL